MSQLIRFLPAALLSISAAASADWTLDPAESRLSFVSTKNDKITEVHRFTMLTGSVADDGNAVLNVGLASAETGIPIRNERLANLLFHVDEFPQATAHLKVDLASAEALKPGQHEIVKPEFSLDLHGVTATLPAELRVTRLDRHHWLVTTESPLVVSAAAFKLDAGLEALRNIAKLQAIADGVPVTLALSFGASGKCTESTPEMATREPRPSESQCCPP